MADLMLSNSTWSAGTTDTASTLQNGIDQKRAEHINGPASAVVAIETILGAAASLKGSYTDLATRLAVQIPASGVIIPTGAIWMYVNATPPSGWLQCDGSTVSRSTYATLFAVIGTTYGVGAGDGLTFSLPDLRSRIPVGAGTGTGGGATGGPGAVPVGGATLLTWVLGKWYGHDTHQLSEAEMPAHTHTVSSLWRSIGGGNNPSGVGTSGIASPTTSTTGSSQPHNNVPAVLCVNFIIKT